MAAHFPSRTLCTCNPFYSQRNEVIQTSKSINQRVGNFSHTQKSLSTHKTTEVEAILTFVIQFFMSLSYGFTLTKHFSQSCSFYTFYLFSHCVFVCFWKIAFSVFYVFRFSDLLLIMFFVYTKRQPRTQKFMWKGTSGISFHCLFRMPCKITNNGCVWRILVLFLSAF